MDNTQNNNKDNNKDSRPDSRRKFSHRPEQPKEEFEQKLVEVRRVTRVTGGGKQLSFRACVVIGDKNGRVGVAAAKGKDVPGAIAKAINRAKKEIIEVPLIDGTIAHAVTFKFKAAKVMLKPARQGRGVIAGGAVRMVLELAGVENIVSKIQGSKNKLNNVKATVMALDSLLKVEPKKKKEEKPKVDAKVAETEVKESKDSEDTKKSITKK
ncbi:MAG: 30S ribosomal protein S5 [Patescibacteria group bacterium]